MAVGVRWDSGSLERKCFCKAFPLVSLILFGLGSYESFSQFVTDFVYDILNICSHASPCVPTSVCIIRKMVTAVNSGNKISSSLSNLSATEAKKRKYNSLAGYKVGIQNCKYFDIQ